MNQPSELELAWAAARAGDTDEARRRAERLIRARPLEADSHLLLGMIHLDEGAVETAIESLRRATFLTPRHALAHFSLGRAYLRLGKRSRAQAAFTHTRQILADAPDGEPISGSGGLLVGELRAAIEAQLAGVAGASPRGIGGPRP